MDLNNPVVERLALDQARGLGIDIGDPVIVNAPPPQDPLSKLDPVLQFLRARWLISRLPDLEIHIIVWIDLALIERLREAPLIVTSAAGDVVAGMIRISGLLDFAALDAVKYLEGPRPMRPQIDRSVPAILGDCVDREHLGSGKGVVLGIIDGGISYHHHAFRANDDSSRIVDHTRIIAHWAQELDPSAPDEASPSLVIDQRFGSRRTYGVRYDGKAIDEHLVGDELSSKARHKEMGDHGSQVAAIAGGNGREGGERVSAFVGVAPEADLMIVSGKQWPAALPLDRSEQSEWCIESPKLFDAANYLQNEANKQPVVINISHNDNIGPHDGTSVFERGLSAIGGGARCIVVVSAGNSYCDRKHAHGCAARVPAELEIRVRDNSPCVEYVDIWYDGDVGIVVSVTPPPEAVGARKVDWHWPRGDDTAPGYQPADRDSLVAVYSERHLSLNGDNRIGISLMHSDVSASVTPGIWTIRLWAPRTTPFHAWIGGPSAEFREHCSSTRHTVMTPGCSENVVTVGAYDMQPHGKVPLYARSASGPTRNGRQKPELCAPGEGVRSIQVQERRTTTSAYGALVCGTSFAAPHVAGTVALMLARNESLTCGDVRHILMTTCRQPPAPYDRERWGAGMLDGGGAIGAAASTKPT